MIAMERPNRFLAEATVSAKALAEKCSDSSIVTAWVRLNGRLKKTADMNPFRLRSNVKMALCNQHKTRISCKCLAGCSSVMLFVAH
ncbi:hypothetical protein DPMN_122304 [Dreissena polymorpha]|uniref:Uncharacterized protein n=1 Tax=Dreissena polymorpha TaxID=45954 RepID=A0A9D4GS89_DREPO|nr:hypothetical protein DPMN_122304 [Dreissena polymorpha]